MFRPARAVGSFVLALVLIASAGCIKQKQMMTLMPDGSGKVEYTFGANEAVFKQLDPDGGSPLDNFTPGELSTNTEGIVAITKPKKWQENGWGFVQFTAYFDDVNKLVLDTSEDEPTRYALTREGEKFTLTAKNGFVGRMMKGVAEDENEKDPAQQAQMKMMLKGFEVSETYAMPATVVKAEGMTVEGKSASVTGTDADVMDREKAKPLAKVQRVIEATGGTTDEATVKAFKDELTKAKADWEAMKKEVKAAPAEDAPEVAPPAPGPRTPTAVPAE